MLPLGQWSTKRFNQLGAACVVVIGGCHRHIEQTDRSPDGVHSHPLHHVFAQSDNGPPLHGARLQAGGRRLERSWAEVGRIDWSHAGYVNHTNDARADTHGINALNEVGGKLMVAKPRWLRHLAPGYYLCVEK